METEAHRIRRWIVALEDLAGQESLLLRGGDPHAARDVQARMSPLVDALAANAAHADPAARARIGAIVARRSASERWLQDALDGGRAELRQIEADRRRLIRMRPAYANREAGGRQLSAVG